MRSRIFSKFSVVLLVLCRPGHSSSSTDIRPALKRECHSKPLSGLKNVLQKPQASKSISRVSEADLLSFTENLMQTRWSILSSIADKPKQEVEKALV
jgi:hypothetical protein